MSATPESGLPVRAMNQLAIMVLLAVFALGFYHGSGPSGGSRRSRGRDAPAEQEEAQGGAGEGRGRRVRGPFHLTSEQEREPRRPTRQEVDEAFRQLAQVTGFPQAGGLPGNVERQRAALEESIRETLERILTEQSPGWQQQVVLSFQRLDNELSGRAANLEQYYRSFAGRRPGEAGARDTQELARLDQSMQATRQAWTQLEGLAVRRGFPEADLHHAVDRSARE